MKRIIVSSLLPLFSLFILACSAGNKLMEGYIIEGQISGTTAEKVKLVKLDLITNEPVIVDSTQIINDKFRFEGSVESPYLHSILIENSEDKIHLFLENSFIEINADLNNLVEAKITGSREDSLFQTFAMDDIFDRKKGLNIILKHPDYTYAAFTAYYLFQVQNISIDTLEHIMTSFSDKVTKTNYYRHLLPLYENLKKTSKGQPAPFFRIPNQQGDSISLLDYKGQYVLLDFWASWCAPCREESPKLVEVHHKFKDRNFSIIGISVDKDEKSWRKAVKSDGMSWTNLSQLKGWDDVSNSYGVKAIPQNFLIDPAGLILEKNINPENLVEVLTTYLN